MDDDDFFKDYPPAEGEAAAPSAAAASGGDAGTGGGFTNAFVFSEPAGDADKDSISDAYASNSNGNGINGLGGGGGGADNDEGSQEQGSPIILGGPPPEEDSEPENAAVTQWRADFARRLEEKVRKEREVKAERAEKARATLETMHARWDRTAKDTHDANKKAEKEFLRQRDGVISRMSKQGDKPNWDIIPELVDMSGKFKEGARDTSRMRQVLLRMKTS